VPSPLFALSIAKPELQIAPMNDSQDQENTILLNDVVHDPVVPHPQSMERVGTPSDRLHSLAAHAAGGGSVGGKALKSIANTRSNRML
jgi:hypothetical protein